MNMMSLDLEMNQPSGNIIEVGYTIGDIKTGEVKDTGFFFTKLPDKESITEYIYKLTSISDNDLVDAISVQEAAKALDALHAKYQCAKMIITWGGGDHYELKKQSGVSFDSIGHSYFDAKKLHQSFKLANGESLQGGLKKVLTKYGLNFRGKAHRASFDSLNTFLIFKVMLDKLRGVK